jgi:2-polyprenyl-3-methyl-5-hydroxy-6-metoxy-1,4-benzoquinol methylase
VKQLLKHGLLTAIGAATRRTAVLLPADAALDDRILTVIAPYRVTGDSLSANVRYDGSARMQATLRAGACEPVTCGFDFTGPATLELDLRQGQLSCGGQVLGNLSCRQPIAARRFSLDLTLVDGTGRVLRRTTSHYLPRDGQTVDERYYSGDDYVDYEAESAAGHQQVLDLVRRHALAGPVLEIGCATGVGLELLRGAGYDACGVDFSSWAVERARARLGDAAWTCDVEQDAWPEALAARAPFGCFVLAAVLEHFARPKEVLARLAALAAPGAGLVIITSNAASLTHRVLDADWEGYFDWTHKSVDVVSPRALRQWLGELGWSLRELRTWHVWDGSTDPTHATLRDWHAADARLRALIAERELGDFIECVAVKP